MHIITNNYKYLFKYIYLLFRKIYDGYFIYIYISINNVNDLFAPVDINSLAIIPTIVFILMYSPLINIKTIQYSVIFS